MRVLINFFPLYRFCETLEDVLKDCETTYDITSLTLDSDKSKVKRRKRPISENGMDEGEDDEEEEEEDKVDSKKAKLELEEYEDLD